MTDPERQRYIDDLQSEQRRLNSARCVRQQQRIELVAPRINPRQRLPAPLLAKLGRLRPDHLAHNLP
jgi:hypothetical protein